MVLCMVLLTGCSDIKPKEALDETPSASVMSDTTVTKENESINNYKYYDVNLINIIDWTTETGAITVPTKIRTNGVTYRYVYNDNGERIAKYIGMIIVLIIHMSSLQAEQEASLSRRKTIIIRWSMFMMMLTASII